MSFNHVPDIGNTLCHMGNTAEARDRARRKALAVLNVIRERINDEFPGDIQLAAREMGVASSTLYRLMENDPERIDVAFLSQVADWLHENRGYEDFAMLWRNTTRGID